MRLAGLMFWAPDLDDFTGAVCNDGKYPLLRRAVELFRGQTSTPTTTPTPTSTPSPAPSATTQSPVSNQKRVVCYYTKLVI